MKTLFTLFTILFLAALPAFAAESDITVLRNFANALQSKNYAEARTYVSANSTDLFDRYTQYDLGAQTPDFGRLISQSANGQYRYLKVSTGTNTRTGQPKATNVAFITEGNTPKIDLPETLRLGFGPNWEQRVNMIEQSYNFSRQQFGEEKSLQLLNSLLAKKN